MPANFSSESLKRAAAYLAALAAPGPNLFKAIDDRDTRVIAWDRIGGGFTLNFLNVIFINEKLQKLDLTDPALETSTDFKWLVCILAHECSHVQQKYRVDSVEQELNAYRIEAQIGKLVALIDPDRQKFLDFDAANPDDLELARAHMLAIAGPDAATRTMYNSLPRLQPTGWADSAQAALKQIGAFGIAAVQSLLRKS